MANKILKIPFLDLYPNVRLSEVEASFGNEGPLTSLMVTMDDKL
ncbi:hypothetical protein [Flavobacterium sp. YO64]|nr:hypothetical protein [Flavobacterium sp. YO64]